MEIYAYQGDSYWYYSQLFNVPLSLIVAANPPNLFAGTSAQIPGYETLEYVVVLNDSLWQIANRFATNVDAIVRLNPEVDPHNLAIGQTLQIPLRVTELIVSEPVDYTYEKMLEDINRLLSVYPFIKTNTIGQSVLGKDLFELQIGVGEIETHINSSFHANEWITTPVIIRFLNEYALALTNHQPIRGLFMLPYFTETLLSIVPMVNPDGVNLVLEGASVAGEYEDEVLAINHGDADFSNWKANIRGVDLNNQFPANWQIEADRKPTTPQPRDFPGYAPLTEPEATAMAELVRERDFERVHALHTQGEVIFWGYENLEPPEAEEIVTEYARVSGYEPIQYVDSHAGFKDWFIQEFQRPGFTIELGRGVNPLPVAQFAEIYEETLGILLANLYLD